MSDVVTVLRKELLEVVGERYSRRGGMVQSIVSVLALGVLLPLGTVRAWVDASPIAILYFAFLPGVLAVTVAADAFAGERERRTLETLLATPLGEWPILLGKAAAALAFAMAVAAFALACAVVTVNVAAAPPSVFLPAPSLVAGALGGALASASLSTGVAILMSMKIPVARSAQQMTALLNMVLFGAIAAAWGALGLPLTWRNVFAAEGILLGLAAIVFVVARATFRRDRFFDKR
ncbi:MAG TPA: ABC transporter permease subunit [Polyangiaceae bacterium]